MLNHDTLFCIHNSKGLKLISFKTCLIPWKSSGIGNDSKTIIPHESMLVYINRLEWSSCCAPISPVEMIFDTSVYGIFNC